MTRAGGVRRLLAVLAGLALLGAAAWNAAAAPASSPLVCPKITAAMSIDGGADDWAGISGVPLDAASAEFVSGVPGSAADVSASLRCAWDTQWLYVLADVSDDILLADSSSVWDDDGVEIAFDGNADRACCSAQDHQFTIVLDSRLADFSTVQLPSPLRWTVMPRVGGYLVEAAVPMTMVLPSAPVSGAVLGFDWGLNDDDDGGRRDKRLLWAGSSILTFATFGDLRLGGAVGTIPTPTAVRTPAGTATATPATPLPATATPTRTPTAPAAQTPGTVERVAALEEGLKDVDGMLDEIWRIMQTAGYLPGTPPPKTSPTPVGTPSGLTYVQRVQCGGGAQADAQGVVWAADQPYAPGSWGYQGGLSYQTTQAIAGTADDALYQIERYNMTSYLFDIPAAVYRVDLRFAEIYQYAAANQRVFDVLIEGTPVISALDIFAQAGAYTAYDRSFDVPVVDGQLTIDFVARKGAAKINAIKVSAVAYAGPTPTPSLSERVANIEETTNDLELLLLQILAVFDRFLGLD